jgi:threonine dehydrogenase-like Zn-dependent dehydrogenase
MGANPLVAVDVDDGRLATAAALGATAIVRSRPGDGARQGNSAEHGGGRDAGPQDTVEAVRAAVGGDGADVVIEASGAPASPGSALSMVRRGGDVVIVGLQAAPRPADLFALSVREIDVHGTLAHVCGDDLGEAVAILAGSPLAKTVLGDVIALGDLVEGGLRPLAERRARGKTIVDVRGSL